MSIPKVSMGSRLQAVSFIAKDFHPSIEIVVIFIIISCYPNTFKYLKMKILHLDWL